MPLDHVATSKELNRIATVFNVVATTLNSVAANREAKAAQEFLQSLAAHHKNEARQHGIAPYPKKPEPCKLASATVSIIRGPHLGKTARIISSLTDDQSIACELPCGTKIALFPGIDCGFPVSLSNAKRVLQPTR